MESSDFAVLNGKDGRIGVIDRASQALDGSQTQVKVQLDDGNPAWVPFELLEPLPDGSYYLPLSRAQFEPTTDTEGSGGTASRIVLPVIEEQLEIGVRERTSGVRVTKQVQVEERLVDEPGFIEEIDVQRVARDQVLESPPSPYYEGETLVIPLVEEVLFVEKRLVLKEEIRITKRRTEVRNPQKVTLRREEAIVEPIDDRETS